MMDQAVASALLRNDALMSMILLARLDVPGADSAGST